MQELEYKLKYTLIKMPVVYRVSRWSGWGSIILFLLFLSLGLYSGIFWLFFFWISIPLLIGLDFGYQRYYYVEVKGEQKVVLNNEEKSDKFNNRLKL